MRVAIIGGTGHIGSYLTPRLFDAGHTVICVSRGLKTPYREHAAWRVIERVEMDRAAEEAAGTFGERIASAGCGGGHRSHLLPARKRAATRRGACADGSATFFTAAQSGCTDQA